MKHLKLISVSAALVILALTPAHVQAQNAAQTAKQPIEITADQSLEWDRGNETFYARGKAQATQGDTAISADTLTANYRSGKNGAGLDIWQFTADNNVTLISGATKAYGDKATYNLDSASATLTGQNLRLDAPDQTITAQIEPRIVTEDDVDDVSARSCPFFLRYRKIDRKPDGASAGMRLSKNEDAPNPGFYYEKDDGTWAYAGGEGKDSALVFYMYREALGRLDMVLSGFSGRATRLLAKTLAIRGQEFWPPVYESPGLQVGAYLVTYDSADNKPSRDDLLYNPGGAADIMPLPRAAIEKRLARR